jgi:predicted Zn-ribbon and HTH transcriptional regulator
MKITRRQLRQIIREQARPVDVSAVITMLNNTRIQMEKVIDDIVHGDPSRIKAVSGISEEEQKTLLRALSVINKLSGRAT